jgi:hypothetical protein
MRAEETEETRAETVTAALRHMQILAAHPDAPAVVREICASLHGAWDMAARPTPESAALH